MKLPETSKSKILLLRKLWKKSLNASLILNGGKSFYRTFWLKRVLYNGNATWKVSSGILNSTLQTLLHGKHHTVCGEGRLLPFSQLIQDGCTWTQTPCSSIMFSLAFKESSQNWLLLLLTTLTLLWTTGFTKSLQTKSFTWATEWPDGLDGTMAQMFSWLTNQRLVGTSYLIEVLTQSQTLHKENIPQSMFITITYTQMCTRSPGSREGKKEQPMASSYDKVSSLPRTSGFD